MRHNYEDASIACPCFVRQDATQIKCEGPVKGSHLTISFQNGRDKSLWAERYCKSIKRCGGCPAMKTIFPQG